MAFIYSAYRAKCWVTQNVDVLQRIHESQVEILALRSAVLTDVFHFFFYPSRQQILEENLKIGHYRFFP